MFIFSIPISYLIPVKKDGRTIAKKAIPKHTTNKLINVKATDKKVKVELECLYPSVFSNPHATINPQL